MSSFLFEAAKMRVLSELEASQMNQEQAKGERTLIEEGDASLARAVRAETTIGLHRSLRAEEEREAGQR